MTHSDRTDIKEFLASIQPALRAYRWLTASFVAYVREGELVILGAKLTLSASPPTALMPETCTPTFRATEISFANGGVALPQIIEQILEGHGTLFGDHVLRLQAKASDGYDSYFDRPALTTRTAVPFVQRLIVSGEDQWTLVNSSERTLERELQTYGYDSLHDLLQEYGLGSSTRTYIEVLAGKLPIFNSESKMEGPSLKIIAQLSKDLPRKDFRISLRSANRADRGTRRSLESSDFEWEEDGDWIKAVYCGDVALGSILDCHAIYSGTIYDLIQLADRSSLSNLRRALVELHDPELAQLTKVLTGIKERDNKLRSAFEASVAVLLYLLGFDTTRLGAIRKMSDGPDIYATTPTGEVLVVECTSDVFSTEKLGKLITRTKKVRERLSDLAPEPKPVFALMVTPRTLLELGPLVAECDKQSVILLSYPQLQQAIEQTRFPPDADALFANWKQLATLRFLSEPRFD